MQSTCTEATRSATLSCSLCQHRSKSWGTEKVQDTKSPSGPRARSSRLCSWLFTSREIWGELGKMQGKGSEPWDHSMAQFISQEGKLRPRKGRTLAGVTEGERCWQGGGGLEGGHWGVAGRPQTSPPGTELGWTSAALSPKSNRCRNGAHLRVPLSIGHLKQIPCVLVGVFLQQ